MGAAACLKYILNGDTQGLASQVVQRAALGDRLTGDMLPSELNRWGKLDERFCNGKLDCAGYLDATRDLLREIEARARAALKNKAGDFGGNQNAAPI